MKKILIFSAGLLAGGLACIAIENKVIRTRIKESVEEGSDDAPDRIYEDLEANADDPDEFADVQNVKADAINHGYVPKKY